MIQNQLIYMSFAPPEEIPYPGCQGKWILGSSFVGGKSFGHFVCNYCDKKWMSAHAMKGYKQGCKDCAREFYPAYMWKNDPNSNNFGRGGTDQDKPHRSDLCQACKRGVCIGRSAFGRVFTQYQRRRRNYW